ncbi:MAG: putative amidoligase domain-containing protein [Deltaproteobacteria bacterium]
MNLNIVYLPNETGKKLHSILKEHWEESSGYQASIGDQDYMVIEITDPESRLRRTVNTLQAIKLCQDSDAIYRIMAANNIYNGPQGNESVNRTYSIIVFDHEVISIKVNTMQKNGEKARYIKEIENNKVADMARRVVSLLGLDLGMVNIDFTARRRFKVTGVEASPELREKDLDKVIDKIRYLYGLDWVMAGRDIKLGADPEFMLANSKSGKMVSASQFFPREGQIGCDNIRVPNRQQRPVAEVRPAPANSPIDLTSNIKKCLDQAARLAPYRNLKWVAGSQPFAGFSIGGHIHFSNIKLDGGLLRILDNYLGIISFLIENPNSAARRRRKYGFLGDYRLKNYGGFEYRTPGSWLVTREITAAMLCLAKIVGSRYYQMNKNYLNNPEAQEAFYQGNQSYFRELFPEIWSDIESLDLYQEYADILHVLPRMINSETIWDETQDIRKSWKIGAGSKRDYSGEVPSSANTGTNYNGVAEVRSVPASITPNAGTSTQRRVIRSAENNSSISYRTPAARVAGSSSNTGRGNALSQGRLSVSSTRRTHITR